MRTVAIIAVLLVAGAAGLTAQETAEGGVTVSTEVSLISKYLWRGFVLNDSRSLEPSVTIAYRGLSVTSFANFSEHVPAGSRAFTEHDLAVDYSRDVGPYTWSVGYTNYCLTASNESPLSVTHEFYAGIARNGLLQPSFKFYRDVDEGDGNYWYASIGHSIAAGKRIAINPTLGVGLNQHMYQPNTTISDVDLGASVDFRINSRVTVSPSFIEMVGNRTIFGHHHSFGLKLAYER